MKASGFKKPVAARVSDKDIEAFVSGADAPVVVEVPAKEATREWDRLNVLLEPDLYAWLQASRKPKQSLGLRTREILRAEMERSKK